MAGNEKFSPPKWHVQALIHSQMAKLHIGPSDGYHNGSWMAATVCPTVPQERLMASRTIAYVNLFFAAFQGVKLDKIHHPDLTEGRQRDGVYGPMGRRLGSQVRLVPDFLVWLIGKYLMEIQSCMGWWYFLLQKSLRVWMVRIFGSRDEQIKWPNRTWYGSKIINATNSMVCFW